MPRSFLPFHISLFVLGIPLISLAIFRPWISIISKEIKIPVQGGLNPKILLTDKENLKKEALKYLDIFKDHPYIFNLGHGVVPETDPKQVDYLVKFVKDY